MRNPDDVSQAEADYADQLLHLSELIVGAAHDPLTPNDLGDAIDRALALEAPPGVDPAVALAAVLAAQVDPDTTASRRLAHVSDEPADIGARPTAARLLQSVLAHLAVDDSGVTIPPGSPEAAVMATILGETRLTALPLDFRGVPVEILRRRGLSMPETAARLHCNEKTVSDHRRRWAHLEAAALLQADRPQVVAA